MATRVGPAGSVRVAVQGTLLGQNIVNVYWAQLTVSGTVTQGDLDTWTAAFGAAFKTDFGSVINGNYQFVSVSAVLFVDGTPTNVLESTQALSGAATGTTNPDAGQAGVVSWLSTAYWRGGKPRSYIALPTGVLSTSVRSTLTSTYITNLGTAAGNFVTAANALTGGSSITGTKLGFVSFFTAGAPRTPPLFFAFTGHKIHPRLAHQRRRDGKWVS